MRTKKSRELLDSLLARLGDGWRRASKSLIYRTDGRYLVQCVSCQSSNFSRDYVPATFIQVIARPSEDFRFDFGGRIAMRYAGDFWLNASVDPPVSDILRLASEQAAIRFEKPLSLEELARSLDQWPRTSFEFQQWWSAGIVYGLCGRPHDARQCLSRAKSQLEKLRSSLDAASLVKAEWLPDAIRSVAQSSAETDDLDRFTTSCRAVARESAVRLGLEGFD